MKTITVQVSSYKKAQVFKRDYVRQNGRFIRFEKCSGNHATALVTLEEGQEFDARGSVYVEGTTKWNASDCQSWAKFCNVNGQLQALNFDGLPVACPRWARAVGVEEPVTSEVETEIMAGQN